MGEPVVEFHPLFLVDVFDGEQDVVIPYWEYFGAHVTPVIEERFVVEIVTSQISSD